MTLQSSPIVLASASPSPGLIYGLAAASVPVILHLLNRRKFREMPWAAMRFLIAAMRKNSRRIRIEQWILLAVRTLVIVLVVLAMAKPFLESLGALPVLAGQRTHRVLVLDGSLSMAYAAGDGTRFEQAKTLAAQLVKDARRGDAISIVLMADPPKVVIGDPSPNHAEVLKEIEEVVMPHGGTDLTASFNKIDEVLAVSTISQKEVVFLTDLQAASWRRPGGSGTTRTQAGPRPDRGKKAEVGRHRPGQGRRREPRRDRPEAQRAGRHRRATRSLVRRRGA